MTQVNMLEAKTDFSRLIRMLENKQEDEIIIAGDNRPVAKIVLFEKNVNQKDRDHKIKYHLLNMEVFEALDTEIEKDFLGE